LCQCLYEALPELQLWLAQLWGISINCSYFSPYRGNGVVEFAYMPKGWGVAENTRLELAELTLD